MTCHTCHTCHNYFLISSHTFHSMDNVLKLISELDDIIIPSIEKSLKAARKYEQPSARCTRVKNGKKLQPHLQASYWDLHCLDPPVGDTTIELKGYQFIAPNGAHMAWARKHETIDSICSLVHWTDGILIPASVLKLNANFYSEGTDRFSTKTKLREGTILALNKEGKSYIEDRESGGGDAAMVKTWRPFSGVGNTTGGLMREPHTHSIDAPIRIYQDLMYDNPRPESSKSMVGKIWTSPSGARILWAHGGDRLRWIGHNVPHIDTPLTDSFIYSLNQGLKGSLQLSAGQVLALNESGAEYISKFGKGLKRKRSSNVVGIESIRSPHRESHSDSHSDSDSDSDSDHELIGTVINGLRRERSTKRTKRENSRSKP